MKRFIVFITLTLACVNVSAQLTSEEYKAKYERHVKNVGYDGVGVETLLDNWENPIPKSARIRLARHILC